MRFPSNTFFTSDLHYSHANIIKYCNRPFQSVEQMDAALIEAWNTKVPQNAIVYHNGDFIFRGGDPSALVKRLNGQITFIMGNHDKRDRLLATGRPVYDSLKISVQKQTIILYHYAGRVWNHHNHGSWLLYGHSHDTIDNPAFGNEPWGRSMDVGVDPAYRILGQYEPFAFEEIKAIMDKRETKVIDHHGA